MRTSEQAPRIVITRTPDAAAELITELTEELSALRSDGMGVCSDGSPEILCVPVHEAEAVSDAPRERAMELLAQVRAGEFDALTLTSKNGVRALAVLATERGIDLAQMLNPVQVACVGESTANELQQLGVRVDFVPSVQDAVHMVKQWPSTHIAQRILCVQGANARPTLEQGLTSLGHSVTCATVYTMSEFPARAPLSARSSGQTQTPHKTER
ncbi:MAG: uroporphyrinogen-III synthase, partial [Rothia sp. (in: high G+C Gram-positive bacteria)]|nr:uroporphyrinogen-III synthase [Rothia sp. (in: high G+C Gram-positive bacteria)]